MKDSPRKRRIYNGAWEGGIYNTTTLNITKTMTQSNWQKGSDYIIAINNELSKDPDIFFNYKRLERVRGFMSNLNMVYTIFFPFLKGVSFDIG